MKKADMCHCGRKIVWNGSKWVHEKWVTDCYVAAPREKKTGWGERKKKWYVSPR